MRSACGNGLLSGRWFSEDHRELGLTGFGRVIECIAGAVGFGGFEEESALEATGKSGEASLAVDVGADLQVEFVGAGEPVGDADFDFGRIDGLVVGVGDGEVGRAGADGGVHGGDGVGVGSLRDSGADQQEDDKMKGCHEWTL